MHRTHLMSGGRYPVLRALGIMYLVMAGLALVGGLIVAGYILAAAPWQLVTRVVWSIVSLAGTFFAIVGLLAVAEVLKLFMDVEQNTRQTAMNSTETFTPAATSGSASSVQIPIGMSESGHRNRLNMLDEETAEAALLRGH